jgi:phosphinothricin acetyltransferase
MEVLVRAGTMSDLPSVVAIYNHYVEQTTATFEVLPVRPEDRTEWLHEHSAGGRYRLLVASGSDDEVLGWATSSRFRPRAAYDTTVETSVYCRPGAERRGIGSRLYGSLFESIQAEDVERIVAGIALPNLASVELHRKFGFRRVGTFHRVGRKFDHYWDVAWFERPARRPAP